MILGDRLDNDEVDIIGPDGVILVTRIWPAMIRPGLSATIRMWPTTSTILPKARPRVQDERYQREKERELELEREREETKQRHIRLEREWEREKEELGSEQEETRLTRLERELEREREECERERKERRQRNRDLRRAHRLGGQAINRQDGQVVIQVAESKFTVTSGSPSD